MKRATSWSWAVVAVAGCATRPRVDRVTAPVAAVAPSAPMVLRFGAEQPYDLRFETDEAGPARSIVDGVRVESDAAGVRVARQAVRGLFAEVYELEGGWAFVSVEGVVARSDTFLGDLTLLGETCERHHSHRATRGRLAITCGDRAFLTDGRALTPAGVTPSRVVEAAFSDARNGAAGLVDGGLVVTSDGGATWRPVALGDDLCVGVTLAGGALRIRTARRTSTLSADGRLTPIADSEVEDEDSSRSDERVHAPEEAVRAVRRGEARDVSVGEVRLPDGSSVRAEEQAVVHLGADGSELSRSSLGANVTLRRWGPSAIVFGARAYQTRDGETYTLLSVPDGLEHISSAPDTLLSNDGVHAALLWPCAGVGEGRSVSSVCVLTNGADRWRDVAREAIELSPYEMHDGALFFGRCAAEGCETRVVDADSGRSWTPELAPDARDLRYATVLHATSDGDVVGVGYRGDFDRDARRWLVHGALFSPLSATPLPDATARVRFFDRLRGVALGGSMRSLSRTLDGGRTWERIEMPIDGVVTPWPERGATRCDASGCVIDDSVRIEGWGPAAPSARRTFNVSLVRAREREVAPPSDAAEEPFAPTRLRCERVGAPVAAQWTVEPLDDAEETTRVTFWTGGSLRVRASDTAARIEWRGESVPQGRRSLPIEDRYESTQITALGEGARGPLLVLRGALVATWAGPRAPRIDVGTALPNVRTDLRGGETSVIPTPAGGVAVLARGFAPRRVLSVAFEIGADGALGVPRLFPQWRRLSGVGLLRGRAAYISISERGAVEATSLAGGAPVAIGTLSSPLRVCADGEALGATPVRIATDYEPDALLRFDESAYAASHQVDLAVSSTSACVVGVVGVSNNVRTRLRASGGSLRGVTVDHRLSQAIRCEVLR